MKYIIILCLILIPTQVFAGFFYVVSTDNQVMAKCDYVPDQTDLDTRSGIFVYSDLDLSFIRKPGFKNSIRAIFFTLKEKRLANNKKVPLESYLCDSFSALKKRYRCDEPPVVIFDPNKEVLKHYIRTLTMEQAMRINDVK